MLNVWCLMNKLGRKPTYYHGQHELWNISGGPQKNINYILRWKIQPSTNIIYFNTQIQHNLATKTLTRATLKCLAGRRFPHPWFNAAANSTFDWTCSLILTQPDQKPKSVFHQCEDVADFTSKLSLESESIDSISGCRKENDNCFTNSTFDDVAGDRRSELRNMGKTSDNR